MRAAWHEAASLGTRKRLQAVQLKNTLQKRGGHQFKVGSHVVTKRLAKQRKAGRYFPQCVVCFCCLFV